MELQEELKLLNDWKRIFDLPKHTEIKEDKIIFAGLGIGFTPDDPRVRYMDAQKVTDLNYLGQFPLVLSIQNQQGTITEKVINPNYRERGLLKDFEQYKCGLITKEYLDAYLV